jgi:type IV pilus assembly protein PilW
MDTVEADLRMASNWGMHSRATSVEGRSLLGVPNPLGLPAPGGCGVAWALDLRRPIDGDNNGYALPCAVVGGLQANSDTVTTRRATVAPVPLAAGSLQVQTNRIEGQLFMDGNLPTGFTAADSETHTLLVNTYYVSASSDLIPGVPTLRRKSLVSAGGGPAIADQEVAPGVEAMQLQFGVDVDKDNTVDRYINPGDPILDNADPAFIPGARVMTARIWLLVRSVSPETGLQDNVNYTAGDVNIGTFNDSFRRLLVSKTILLRNARS